MAKLRRVQASEGAVRVMGAEGAVRVYSEKEVCSIWKTERVRLPAVMPAGEPLDASSLR